MPAEALPYEPAKPTPVNGAVPYSHEYRDAIGRPLSGTATVLPGGNGAAGAPFPVPVVGGQLAIALPPGTYTITAALRTPEGAPVTDTHVATV